MIKLKTKKGKVEIGIELLTETEAEENPVGLGRGPPQPLPVPNRPQTSFLWFAKPMSTFRYIIWRNHWKKLIGAFIFLLLFIVIFVFFIQLPNFILNKLAG